MTGQVVRLDRRSLVWRAGVASVRFRARTAGACVVLVALVVLIAVVALGLGSFQVSAPDVVRALFRRGRRRSRPWWSSGGCPGSCWPC